MSAEVWALVGVVVGAVLGGLAQIIGGTLSDDRSHKMWVRERRVDAYQAVLVHADDLLARFQEVDAVGYSSGPVPEFFDGGMTALMTVVELFGARSVIDAGNAVLSAVCDFADTIPGEQDVSKQIRKLIDAREAYVKAVRADLAVGN